MTKLPKADCPICGHWGADGTPISRSEPEPVNCERCGHFSITHGAVLRLSDFSKRRLLFLSAAARQASEAGRPLSVTRDNIEQYIELHESTRKTEKIDKLLRYIAHKSITPGAACEITPDNDYPLVDAENSGELSAYLNHINAQGLVVTTPVGYGMLNCQLTIQGWEKAEPPVGPVGIPGRCFVAMLFSMVPVFDEAISPAVTATGYDPIFMKEVKTSEEITARIMAEIRKAR